MGSAANLGCGSDSISSVVNDPTDAGEAVDGGFADASGTDTPDAGFASNPGDVGTLPRTVTLGGDRPAEMWVPSSYDGSQRPIVVLLHGYTSSGSQQNAYFGLSDLVDAQSFFLVLPDGTREQSFLQSRFWNATDACCNFTGSDVDDVAYIVGLIDEASALFNVDPNRVHAVGHSNGGFMAYRLACDAADRFASIASLAGATFNDERACAASEPVSVLQLHGTLDGTIAYGGGSIGANAYPGAEETVARWALRAQCAAMPEAGPVYDLSTTEAAAETEVFAYPGCSAGISVELWRMNGSGHVPQLRPAFAERVVEFLLDHPKP